MGLPFRFVWMTGDTFSLDEIEDGRRFGLDPRCVADDGHGVSDAYAHVCALPSDDARIPFDQPEVQQARRDALAWYVPMLGDDLICLTTLSLDAVHYGGAITVARDPRHFVDDPFARLFPGRTVRTSFFSAVPPPTGPVLERYAGVTWPGGSFKPDEGEQ